MRYQRTVLGQQTLLQRHIKIPARARRLLLLIESENLKQLDRNIVNDEYLIILINLGLITQLDHTQNNPVKALDVLQSNLPHLSTTAYPIKNSEQDHLPLSFVEIKTIMQNTLQQYCGLMAKSLIHAIEQAQTTEELRLHQTKWLTDLFETRMPHQQLTALKHQINSSIQRLELIHQHS